MKANSEWSEELKSSTRRAVEEGRTGFAGDGIRLHMKNISREFGYMTLADLRDGALRVVDKNTEEVTTFDDVESLIQAGWAID